MAYSRILACSFPSIMMLWRAGPCAASPACPVARASQDCVSAGDQCVQGGYGEVGRPHEDEAERPGSPAQDEGGRHVGGWKRAFHSAANVDAAPDGRGADVYRRHGDPRTVGTTVNCPSWRWSEGRVLTSRCGIWFYNRSDRL